jgi:hypothetical protein
MLIAKSIRIMKFGASRRRVAPTIELKQVKSRSGVERRRCIGGSSTVTEVHSTRLRIRHKAVYMHDLDCGRIQKRCQIQSNWPLNWWRLMSQRTLCQEAIFRALFLRCIHLLRA